MSKTYQQNITYIFIAVVITAIIAIFYPWEKKEWRFSDIVVSPDVNAKVAIGAPLTIKLNEEKLSEADSVIVRYTGNQADAKVTSAIPSIHQIYHWDIRLQK